MSPSQASSSARYHLRLFDVDGKDLPTVLVEVRIVETTEPGRIIGGEWYPPSRQTHPDFLWWPVGQQGRPKEIYGPFDGYFSNTLITIGGQEVKKLAESPRKLVFESPKNLSGLTEILLRERNVEAKGEYRNVGVRLSAPKTNLTRGERTTLTIQVNGLQGIDKPMPLTLESHGVITMEGGSFQPLMIQPSQVTADGRYTTTRGVTGLQTGAWEATATVVTQPFNIILRDPDPPQTLLFNSFTGDYIFRTGAGKFSGAAQVKRQDCMAQVNSNQKDHELRGTINVCVPVDTGRFWFLHAAGTTVEIKITVTDTQPPRRKIYINPLGKPAPPIQDTSAFATCP